MIRGLLLLACSSAVLALVACGPKEHRSNQLSKAEIQGEWLYESHCAECHENPHPELRKQPPNLHRLFLAKSLPSGAPGTEEQVRKTIIDGRGTMPAFDQRLREQDVRNLVQYLSKLK